MAINYLRCPAVLARTGKPKSSLYDDIAAGLFPKGTPLGLRAVGWPEDRVERVNAARRAGKSQDEIKALVAEMNAGRDRPEDHLAAAREAAAWLASDLRTRVNRPIVPALKSQFGLTETEAVAVIRQAQGGADETP